MTSKTNLPDPGKLLRNLETSQDLRHQAVESGELEPRLAHLRAWQSARLGRTYADLMKDPQYRPACEFFLSNIYAPRDFSQRDHDTERIHTFLSKVVPAPMLQLLTDVVEVNALTNELDQKLIDVLFEDLAVTSEISAAQYAAAYRRCDNYKARYHQINLITRILGEIALGARLAGVGLAMNIIKGPAVRAGWVDFYDFLAQGYAAFKKMRDVKTFVRILDQREKRILSRIYTHHPDPFSV